MLTTRTKIALAAAVQRTLTALPGLNWRGRRIEATRSGIRWSLDLGEGIDFAIWLLGAFEKRTVAAYSRLVQPGMTVIDIGANIGAHTLPLAKLVGPTGRVIAVEPTIWAVERLRANLDLNPPLRAIVDVRQVMLVGGGGQAVPDEIYASWPLHGRAVHPKLRALPKSTLGAQAMTLDELGEIAGIKKVDFIKLDVDGYEGHVLRGARAMLKRDRPIIVLELSPYILAERGNGFEDLIGILRDCDYRLDDLRTRRPLPSDTAALAAMIPDAGSINVIASPA